MAAFLKEFAVYPGRTGQVHARVILSGLKLSTALNLIERRLRHGGMPWTITFALLHSYFFYHFREPNLEPSVLIRGNKHRAKLQRLMGCNKRLWSALTTYRQRGLCLIILPQTIK
jgi:hypothetical protein